MTWLFSCLVVFCLVRIFGCIEFVENAETKEFSFELKGGNLNCRETLFSSHSKLKQFQASEFIIQENFLDQKCQLSLRKKFTFLSSDLKSFMFEVEENVLSLVAPCFQQSFPDTIFSLENITASTTFLDIIHEDYIRVVELRQMFLCNKLIHYDYFGTYVQFLESTQAKNCTVCFKSTDFDEEPESDMTPISDIISSKKYFIEECISVHFQDYNHNCFLIRKLSCSDLSEALELVRQLVYAEFKYLAIEIENVEISWSSLRTSSIDVIFPESTVQVIVKNRNASIANFDFDPFSDLDKLWSEIQDQLMHWKVSLLLHDKVDIFSKPKKHHLKKRTAAEKLAIVHRGFVSSKYMHNCFWQHITTIISGTVILHGTFLVPYYVEFEDKHIFEPSDTSLQILTKSFNLIYPTRNLKIFPIENSIEEMPMYPNSYIVKEIETIPFHKEGFATVQVYLKDEIPFWAQISTYLKNISYHLEHQDACPSIEYNFSLHSLDKTTLSSLIDVLVESTSVALLDSTSSAYPAFCKTYPNSKFCENVAFLENHFVSPLYPSLFVTWGFSSFDYCIKSDPLTKIYIENAKMSFFEFDEIELNTKLVLAVFAMPSTVHRIRYVHRIRQWDSSRDFTRDFSNFDWMIISITKMVPKAFYAYIPFKKVQWLVTFLIEVAFQILQEFVGKIEYSLITNFIVKPHLFSFLQHSQSLTKNVSLTIQFIQSLNIPFSTHPFVTRLSPFIGKYIELPIITTVLNETINALSQLKSIPFIIFKRLAIYFMSKKKLENSVMIYNPITFDNRLRPYIPPQTLVAFSDISHVKSLHPSEIFSELRQFGLVNYISSKIGLISLKTLHSYIFTLTKPTPLDYSQRFDRILIAKLAQHINLEPKTVTLFEQALSNMFKNVFHSFQLNQWLLSEYSERIGAMYAAKIFAKRAEKVLNVKESEINKKIGHIDKGLAAIRKSLDILKEVKKTLSL